MNFTIYHSYFQTNDTEYLVRQFCDLSELREFEDFLTPFLPGYKGEEITHNSDSEHNFKYKGYKTLTLESMRTRLAKAKKVVHLCETRDLRVKTN